MSEERWHKIWFFHVIPLVLWLRFVPEIWHWTNLAAMLAMIINLLRLRKKNFGAYVLPVIFPEPPG